MAETVRRAVVVGAGIGGLTAAVALHRRGWRVTVCERAPEPSATGAGIVLAPNALLAFEAIGFDVVRAAGTALPAAMGLRRPGGGWLHRADTAALAARYGSPPLAVYRPALAAGLAAALPRGVIRYGTPVTAVEPGPAAGPGGPRALRTPPARTAAARGPSPRTASAHGPAARPAFAVTPSGRASAARTPVVRTPAGDLAADVVIAADGIRSALRRQHFPDHPGLRYSGETAWRAVLPAAGLPEPDAAETWGRGERFGVVPLADGRVYVYATAVVERGFRPEDPRAELLARFGSWHAPVPELLARIRPAAVLQHDLYDLAAPLPCRHRGRIAWLGDAAHAMTPNLGQGGCQAIEDAVVLAHLLDGGDVPEALAAYGRARHARTDALRVRSRRAGRIASLAHPVAVAARDLALRATPARVARRAMDDLFDGFRLPPADRSG
ncbi:FAD-dependent monooxygenase [Streptomyces sp. NPDC087897]|uniref:FAD-dependent monooxygenase n=1 Tax=Streptomyces sp. NPDC087897 TaxID=3365817 RepID=UPI0038261A00